MNRVFWFSPVPPARTDIAQYSLRVVPHLTPLIDLDVVGPDINRTDSDDGVAEVLPWRPAGTLTMRDLNASHLCVYNIGNNPVFHGQIMRTCLQHPGIVVLHDRSLQDLCYAILDEKNGAGSYQTVMSHWYGRTGREGARAVLAGDVPVSDLAQDFPLFEVVLQGALGVVTHNPDVAAEIADRFPGLPIITLHLPYESDAPHAPRVPALRPDQPIRLVMFGYLNPNRRLCEFLRAWGLSPWRKRFELDLAGELNNGQEVQAAIAETGLGGQIRIHGFLADDQLDALIAGAHLVLNLRNPTMGEASGSQLRIWANGAASVVSDTGWYRRLPEGSVLRVTTEREHSDLLMLLDDLAERRIDLDTIARRGGACLTASDPRVYALTLAEWLESEREAMFARWADAAQIEAIARTYARCTPTRFIPKLPGRLLA